MRPPSCIFSSASALRRVFLSDLNQSLVPRQQNALPRVHGSNRSAAAAVATLSTYARRTATHPTITRRASCLISSQQAPRAPAAGPATTLPSGLTQRRNFNGKAKKREKERKPNERLKNGDIPYTWVRLVTESGISEPMRRNTVLRTLDKKKDVLVMVSKMHQKKNEGEEEEEEEEQQQQQGKGKGGLPAPTETIDDPDKQAICRVMDVVEERRNSEEMRLKAQRGGGGGGGGSGSVTIKELELGWAITDHDLAHKIRRAHGWLAKGQRVNVLLARKKGMRATGKEDCRGLVDRVAELMVGEEGVPGAKEYKKRHGDVGMVYRMFFEAPEQKKSSSSSSKKKGAADARAALAAEEQEEEGRREG